jgi:hypothetical protein
MWEFPFSLFYIKNFLHAELPVKGHLRGIFEALLFHLNQPKLGPKFTDWNKNNFKKLLG